MAIYRYHHDFKKLTAVCVSVHYQLTTKVVPDVKEVANGIYHCNSNMPMERMWRVHTSFIGSGCGISGRFHTPG